ncbi:MAG: 16S rRNA (uracil(1498)-N(3))-methyltransferase [Thermoguttaceae bacterium]|nr:16S rRNA (uracil(1498)-N(3))-methyltransferase [Thermoguttaceae bacterium]MDW8038445.1 16S rRNA (uracil(1498)-N(3))-methyltransferase [Thermoguttaceae bacterium]
MSERFFIREPIHAERARLSGPEAHHLLHVMRAKVGDRIVLFDGTGWEYEAQLVQVSRQEAQLAICHRCYVDRELPIFLVLAVAMPKGDRQKWLVEKAVELGVGRLVPLVANRSVAHPSAKMLDRLRRTVIEASKQCGRNLLMEIHSPMSWAQWLAAYQPAQLRWVADPSGSMAWPQLSQPPERSTPDMPPASAEAIGSSSTHAQGGKPLWAAAVGPEGGWTQAELAQAQAAGWHLVSLGTRILRTETAALALAALLGSWATYRFGLHTATS